MAKNFFDDPKYSAAARPPSPFAAPTLPFQVPQAQAQLTGSTISNEKNSATLPYEIQKAKNDAAASASDAKTKQIQAQQAQEQWNITHPSANGNEGLTGPAYMKYLQQTDPGRAAYVQGLSEGRVPFPSSNMMRTPAGQALLAQVMRADPTIDATNYSTRAAARVNAAKGTLGQSDNALVTAIGHAARLEGQVPNVFGTSVTPFNYVANGLDSTLFGGKQPAYDQNAQLLGDEVAAAYGTNSQGKQNEAGAQFSSSLSTKQKQDNILGAIDLMASKLAANRAQFAYGNGQLGKPDFTLLPPQVKQEMQSIPGADKIFAKYFAGVPVMGGGNVPPSAPPSGPTPPIGPQGAPPDLSGMTGQTGGTNLATGSFRNQYDPIMAQTLSAFIQKGTPYDTAAQYAQSHGFSAPNAQDYAAAVAFAKAHGGATNVQANRLIPTTLGERLSASPLAAGVAGAATGASAGLSDVAGRTLVGPQWDANRQALAATNPVSDLAGNVIGGIGGMFGAGAAGDALGIAAKAREALGAARAAKLGQFAPLAQDIGYGATYGASEDPNNPLGGAVTGALTAGAGGIGARTMMRATGRAIAPTGGNLAPLYQANPDFAPSVGQAMLASNSSLVRGAGKLLEPPIPLVSGIQNGARQAATDQMQRGAYNLALSDIGQQLPPGVTKGAAANEFLQNAMSNAQQSARSAMQFAPDQQFQQELGAWQRSPDAMSLTNDQTAHVQKVIGQAMNGRVNPDGTMTGPNYAAAASDLGSIARNWAGNSATTPQASYLRDYIGMMDDAASRASPDDAAANLQAANNGYAKSVILENAAKSAGGDSTEFTGKQLLKAVQNSDSSVRDRAFLRGQALMQDYATAASKLAPPASDTVLGTLAGLGEVGGAAYLAPHAMIPFAADTIANLPGVRNVIGAAMAPRGDGPLGNAANLVGQGMYNRANQLGMFGAPLALGYMNQ